MDAWVDFDLSTDTRFITWVGSKIRNRLLGIHRILGKRTLRDNRNIPLSAIVSETSYSINDLRDGERDESRESFEHRDFSQISDEPCDIVEAREVAELVYEVVSSLTAQQRRIVVDIFYVGGFNHGDIVHQFNLSVFYWCTIKEPIPKNLVGSL